MNGSGVRPVFKGLFFVRSLPGGMLRIGEASPNRAVEIADEDGWVERLIRLMDGTRTVERLWRDLAAAAPSLTIEDVSEIVAELDRLGYVDDQGLRDECGLGPDELERFRANVNYFSYYSSMGSGPWGMQERLRGAEVTVIGAGALGCGVLLNLAGLGVTDLRIVDFDVVELSNLNRQMLYAEKDIGRRKIDVASEFLARFHFRSNPELVDMEITSAADAKKAISGSDLVVLAADQPYWLLERWVNQACSEAGIPFIAGGMNLCEGQVYAVVPGRTGCAACIDLQYGQDHAEHAAFLSDFRDSDFRMPSASIAPNYMVLAGIVGGEIARWFTGTAEMRSAGRVLAMNFDTYALETRIDFARRIPECPVCKDVY
ncbi:ThiF family adenylyltransferase [Cohnella sp. CFH 77786]|uniref:HesA/MoeB/ThiF family protein n=1 Tax=Cohnella sp. CFH 77786 TaxID=2662265 RepID=UPI001C60BDF5|nr:ThiF family adenylyltransferase [Cohnella sp. CFH 77786]MBW5446398.1 ThiF family adenylyltransferase [Cohnella sp. CFH 77786]